MCFRCNRGNEGAFGYLPYTTELCYTTTNTNTARVLCVYTRAARVLTTLTTSSKMATNTWRLTRTLAAACVVLLSVWLVSIEVKQLLGSVCVEKVILLLCLCLFPYPCPSKLFCEGFFKVGTEGTTASGLEQQAIRHHSLLRKVQFLCSH